MQFAEPVPVPEIYIDGIAAIEQIGPNLKLAFFTLQRMPGSEPHSHEGVIVARFVMPKDAVHSAAMQALAASDTQLVFDQVN